VLCDFNQVILQKANLQAFLNHMKNHAKVGNRSGRPGYRTPAVFRFQQAQQARTAKAANFNFKKFK